MRTSDFDVALLDRELMASEDHCPACTQWGPESARRAVVWRKTVLVQHRRCTKPAGDATATTWPSRVLLLVERRGGPSRASCAMELIPSDAADTRNRRWPSLQESKSSVPKFGVKKSTRYALQPTAMEASGRRHGGSRPGTRGCCGGTGFGADRSWWSTLMLTHSLFRSKST